MILLLGFDIFEGHAGLSIYTRDFINIYQDKAIILNIRSKSIETNKLERYLVNDKVIYDYDVKGFNILTHHSNIKKVLDLLVFETHKNEINMIVYPDFIVGPYIDFNLYKEKNIKTIMMVHLLYRGFLYNILDNNTLINSEMNLTNIASWIEGKTIKQSDYIICNSDYTQRMIHKCYPDISPDNIYTYQLGIDKDKFTYCPKLDNNDVLYFGRLCPQKGINYIINDVEKNINYYKNNPIHVCTGMGYQEYIDLMIKKSYFNEGIKYLGNKTHNEIVDLLKNYKYCIFPSIYEPYCLALNEALSMGKVCIVNSQFDSGMLDQIDDSCAIKLDFSTESLCDFLQKNSETDWTNLVQNARNRAKNYKEHFINLHKLFKKIEYNNI
jgi:glycosyltransferase involved in cell wall biosynthesis